MSTRKRAPRKPSPRRAGRKTLPASEFKAHCLRVLDEVATGQEVVITKHGREVAVVSPISGGSQSSYGSWSDLVEVRGDIIQVDWSDEFEASSSE